MVWRREANAVTNRENNTFVLKWDVESKRKKRNTGL